MNKVFLIFCHMSNRQSLGLNEPEELIGAAYVDWFFEGRFAKRLEEISHRYFKEVIERKNLLA